MSDQQARTAPQWAKGAAAVAALAGAVLLAVGLILGYGSINQGGVNCGSAFGGATDNGIAQDYLNAMEGQGASTATSDACTSGLSSRKTVSEALAWPGGVLLATGLIALVVTIRRPVVAPEVPR